jgi:phospholipase A1
MNRITGAAGRARGLLLSCSLLACYALDAQARTGTFNDCVLGLIEHSAAEVTVAEIRDACQAAEEAIAPTVPKTAPAATPEEPESAIDRRLSAEGATEVIPFVITPHKPNYIIYSYNFKDYQDPTPASQPGDEEFDKASEVDFQVSIKFPVLRNMFNTRTQLFAAYTNRSFWQVFDRDGSSPFRETDHEPELWLSHRTRWNVLGLTNRLIQAGIVHQSNGNGGEDSRSWNRVYANLIFERGHYYFSVKPWWRLQENKKDDDNPDIEDYMGYFEFQGIYNRNRNNFGLFFRNTLKEDYRGAVQLDWGFPVYENLRGYVQYFYGYGESLIDYNNKVNKLGIGIKLTDWL